VFPAIRLTYGFVLVAVLAAFIPAHFLILGVGVASLLVLLALDVRRAPRPQDLQLARQAPDAVGLGRRVSMSIRLHNPTDRPLEVTLRDIVPRSLGRTPDRHRASIPPRGWDVLSSEATPGRRGRVLLGPVVVRTRGPLGLGGRQQTVPLDQEMKVYPALPGRAEVELRLDRARLLQSGQRSTAIRGGGTDFDALREYHPDDEFRRINWRATARSAKPITNVYREERNQQVLLLIDASRMMAGSVLGVSRLEHAIDGAVAIAQLAARVGDHVGIVAFAGRVLASVGPKGGSAQPRRILETLFDLEPTLDSPNYREAFGALLARHRRRALLILLTDLVDEAVLDPLYQNLPSLLARHLVVVGSVLDPQVESFATSVPSSSEEAYLKAAAMGALSSRDRAAARLRRMGAVVIDAPAGELAGRLADQYLRIKAYGRL
jgi:uncharacterized protein (DUF58 family)